MTANLLDRAREEAASSGRHPFGTFPGTIIDVTEKTTPRGNVVFEVLIQTTHGRVRTSIWRNLYDEQVGTVPVQEQPEAEAKYVKHLGRLIRLYDDLGLQKFVGATHLEVEAEAYGRLGELIDRPCSVVVKDNDRSPQNPLVFINAPKGAAKPATARAASFDGMPSEIPAGETPDLPPHPGRDDIPF